MEGNTLRRASPDGPLQNLVRYACTGVCKIFIHFLKTLAIVIVAAAIVGLLVSPKWDTSTLSLNGVFLGFGREVKREDPAAPPMEFGLNELLKNDELAIANLAMALNERSPNRSLPIAESGNDLPIIAAANEGENFERGGEAAGVASDSGTERDVISEEEDSDAEIDLNQEDEQKLMIQLDSPSPQRVEYEDPMPGREPVWQASYNRSTYYNERRRTSCYMPVNPMYRFSQLVPQREFEMKECQKYLPKVVIAGMRKCGTGTLMRYLNMHPHVAVTNYEVHYFDNNFEHRGDLKWYRRQMQYSTPIQVPMEKTPTYFFRPYDAPRQMREVLSEDVKIIVILCDPINRAVSDYLEYVRKFKKAELGNVYSRKYLAETFEDSVLNKHNEVRVYSEIVDAGIYVKYVHRWMEYFPLQQMLFLDGDKFKVDPAAQLRRTEVFVGLKPFFRREHFYLDPEKGFYCINYPHPFCMTLSKGRDHPEVTPKVLQALCHFYTPYDKALETTLNQKFSWVGKC